MKILANGEIVADDDPRAQQTPNSASQRRPTRSNVSSPTTSSNPDSSSSSSWSFGLGNPAADGGAGGGGRGGIGTPTNTGSRGGANNNDGVQTESVTVFDLINARMLGAGFPRLNLGPYSVDPIAVVGTCIALLLFGLPGLVLSLGLFLAVKFSSHGIPSIADFTGGGGGAAGGRGAAGGGGAERIQRSNGRRNSMDGDADERDSRRKSPEEEKWGTGQRLGGR